MKVHGTLTTAVRPVPTMTLPIDPATIDPATIDTATIG
jgi:hypothetical protein